MRIIFFLFFALLTGCQAADTPLPKAQLLIKEGRVSTHLRSGNYTLDQGLSPGYHQVCEDTASTRSRHITQSLLQVDAVTSAAALISDDKLIVAVLHEETAPPTLKQDIEKAAKAADKQIEHVMVSTNKQVFKRVSEIR